MTCDGQRALFVRKQIGLMLRDLPFHFANLKASAAAATAGEALFSEP